ncbi:MAG: MATE family efflux transporter [Victivallales bacterium]|nr:MATE family efflux transporter [Victivallales bacterium]
MNQLYLSIRKRHFDGPGGILELLPIAIPMFFSTMFDMLMMFIDRLFLSHVGVVHQAAAMTGGITSWMVVSFFVGIVGYNSTLTAQYYGAGQKYNCVRMVRQSLWCAIASYPLILLIDCIVSISPVFSGHSELEQVLERRYFWYMAFGSVNALARFVFGSFFTGIGQTKVLLVANSVALLVNVVANWVLIFGHLGCPALGLDGAAIGTVMSGASAAITLMVVYWRARQHPEWEGGRKPPLFEVDKLFKLIRYGLPQGVENILSMICFVFLVSSLHSYGDDMAAATTIAFNWDSFSFHPLLGVQVAVSTLVGQAMGAELPDRAVRVARSGYKVAIAYAGFMLIMFVSCTGGLVGVFTPESSGLDYGQVREYAIPMLRLTGVYLLTDALLIIASGALRGAGDTLWCMLIHIMNNIVMTLGVMLCVYMLKLRPLQVWLAFVIMGALSSTMFIVRYKMGRWKSLRIIEKENEPRMDTNEH